MTQDLDGRRDRPVLSLLIACFLMSGACGGGSPASPPDAGAHGHDAATDAPAQTSKPDAGSSPLAIGQPCTLDGQCASGFCADGVCCATRCGGACQTCAGAGRVGSCFPADPGTDPRNDCTDMGAASCGTTGACDGAGGCEKYRAGVTCAASSCTGQTLSSAGRCDGLGNCLGGQMETCAPFTCAADTAACKTTCQTDADCASPLTCNAGSCGRQPIGAPCATASDCNSGFCAQGVCCATACTGTCTSCALAASVGTCTNVPAGDDPLDQCAADAGTACGQTLGCNGAGACQTCALLTNGTRCTTDGQCSSGFCEQGVCCGTSCTGTCRSCAVSGSAGTCVNVPAGQDPLAQCSDAGASTCGLDGFCDGAGACQRYAAGTTCAAASCTGSTFQPAATCNGSGTCGTPATTSCAPYVCGTGSCKTSCQSASDCLGPVYACASGKCTQAVNVSVQTHTLNGSNTTWIYFDVQVTNTGSAAISLSDLTIDYWYTWEGSGGASQTWQCTYANGVTGSCANVTGQFIPVTPARTGADYKFQLGFASAAGSLAAGATIDIGPGFYKSDFSSFVQTNDYSYNSSTTFTPNTKVTVYSKGTLIYGTEPS